jgi:hypothetical protein
MWDLFFQFQNSRYLFSPENEPGTSQHTLPGKAPLTAEAKVLQLDNKLTLIVLMFFYLILL